MSAKKHSNALGLRRLNARLYKFEKQHPALFKLLILVAALILAGLFKLLESGLK